MLIRALFIISSFLLIQTAFGQQEEIFEQADVPPQPPGGLEGFYQFIKNNIIYPFAAQAKGIEGRVFVSFIIDAYGDMETESVKTVLGLELTCDKEAVRVIRSFPGRWTAAMKGDKPVRQIMVLPISFKLTDSDEKRLPMNVLPVAMKATIQAKPIGSNATNWKVFSDMQGHQSIGTVEKGDSVEVIGWAPWQYMIKNKSIIGFVSYKALKVTDALIELANKVETESANLDAALKLADSLVLAEKESRWRTLVTLNLQQFNSERKAKLRSDSLEFAKNPPVFFHLNTSRKSLTAGECVSLELSLYVSRQNAAVYQFYNLGTQLSGIFQEFKKDSGWNPDDRIENVAGFDRFDTYTAYPILSGAYCPSKAGTVSFKPVTLQMIHIDRSRKPQEEKIISFSTKPVTISVSSLQQSEITTADLYKMVGKYIVADTIASQTAAVGDPVNYSITVKGIGLTFPLSSPDWKTEDFSAELINVQDVDTVINETYFSSKTFLYSLVFKKEGTFDYSDRVIFSAFDPKEKKIDYLKAGPRITVTRAAVRASPSSSLYFKKDNIIAIDISQSMMIEDYTPSRLDAVLTGIKGMLSKRNQCDIGLIIFGGESKPYRLAKGDSCYSGELIDKIDYRLVGRGTAIGDALWLAIHSTTSSTSPKKVVIIGDGDNTAGFFAPTAAIALALKYKVNIYAIGVGNSGWVPFGKDGQGKPHMVENTFSDVDFKRIASSTGGKYYWAKDANAVRDILKQIFK
jgi:hypothetical protein